MSRAAVAALVACFAVCGCGAPEEQVVARETPESQPPLPSQRSRVTVVDSELSSDIGTPLRGLLLPVDYGWTLDDFGLIQSIAETTGLNAVHVYLENWTHVTGAMRNEADALVSLTAQAGLYLVLGIGGGPRAPDHPGNGWFDIEKVRSFWSLYAPRYRDSSHVIYEIQNNPEVVCADPMRDETIAMEREAYVLIRSLAPDTHVVLFSTMAVPQPSVLDNAIQRVADVVDWSNASIGMHSDLPCVTLPEFGAVARTARSNGAPLLVTQLPLDDWASHLEKFEQFGIGWLHLKWLSRELDIRGLVDETSGARIEWCPDRGTFPMDHGKCRAW